MKRVLCGGENVELSHVMMHSNRHSFRVSNDTVCDVDDWPYYDILASDVQGRVYMLEEFKELKLLLMSMGAEFALVSRDDIWRDGQPREISSKCCTLA